jgi:[ribosomal protein S5]-alanine N-acetyltransferase
MATSVRILRTDPPRDHKPLPNRVELAVPELQPLHSDHAPAVLAFELANRAYFAAFINDRGDDFYDHFTDRHNAMLAEQEAGTSAFYVLVADDGSVLGRFNLFDISHGTAKLGFRVAQHVAGRGVATASATQLCRLAVERHGLRTLRAAAASANAASQKVLIKAGFVQVGPADPADLGGKPGSWYERDLVIERLACLVGLSRSVDAEQAEAFEIVAPVVAVDAERVVVELHGVVLPEPDPRLAVAKLG